MAEFERPGTEQLSLTEEAAAVEVAPDPPSPRAMKLQMCEVVIARTLNHFKECAGALATILEEHLWRETHTSFESYCKERWNLSKQRVSQMMHEAEVMAGLERHWASTTVDGQSKSSQHRVSGRVARELWKTQNSEERNRLFDKAEAATGGNVTAKAIAEARDLGRPKDAPPEPETEAPRGVLGRLTQQIDEWEGWLQKGKRLASALVGTEQLLARQGLMQMEQVIQNLCQQKERWEKGKEGR